MSTALPPAGEGTPRSQASPPSAGSWWSRPRGRRALGLDLALLLSLQVEGGFSLEPMVQLAPAQELALGLELMLVVALALEGLMEVTLAPALAQVVELELELDLAVELALALALELEGALEMILQHEKETVSLK